jgi:hypothetical protein
MTKRSFRRRIARLVGAIGAFALAWACNAPFIPVPPPNQVTFTSDKLTDSAGVEHTFWITQGGPDNQAASALYYVYDTTRQAGVITQAAADGSFQAPPFEGAADDRVQIHFQRTNGDSSDVACKLLREGPDPAPDCPP